MAVDILSSLNKNGSGLNITQISEDLATAEIDPKRNLVQKRIDEAELQMSGVDRLRAQLEALDEALSLVGSLNTRRLSSSASAVSVVSNDGVTPGDVNTQITVEQLASPQVLEFGGYDSPDAVLGGGDLTIEFGSWSEDTPPVFTADPDRALTLTMPEGTTLREMAAKLDQITGLSTQIVDTGDGTYSLGVMGETGASNALRFTAGATAEAGLAGLDFSADPTTVQVRAAQDAQLTMNGISVSRASNTVDDLIEGATLTLNAPTTVAAVIQTEIDEDSAFEVMQGFVDVMNATRSLIRNLTSRGYAEGGEAGELAGDSLPEGILRKLDSALTTAVPFDGGMANLSDMGISTDRSGRFVVDTDALASVITREPTRLEALLFDRLEPVGDGITIGGSAPNAQSGSYLVLRDAATGAVTLNGLQLTDAGTDFDGNAVFTVPSGDLKGLKITLDTAFEFGEISVGRSMITSMRDVLDDALGTGQGLDLRSDELTETLTSQQEAMDDLDARYETVHSRYLMKFTEMEQIVTQLNSTGEYLTNLIDAWNSDN